MFFLFNFLSSSLPNGVYYLKNNVSAEIYPAYCSMTETPECGAGGWTLAVKIDGNLVRQILFKKSYMQLHNTALKSARLIGGLASRDIE